MEIQKVYLSGGFKSNWSDLVTLNCDGFIWIDPKQKENNKTMTINEYATWDLHFIKKCDIIFIYVEKTNTSCIGLSVEAGFARGLGKTVILILEPNHESIKDNYLKFLTKVSDVTFENLQDGINYLKSFYI